MKAGYELFDHTADIGIRVWAPTLAELPAVAAEALYAVIGEIATLSDRSPLFTEHRDGDSADLLRDFLAELLLIFERDDRCLTQVDHVEFTEDRLVLRGWTQSVDLAQSTLQREVKAVTYHELAINPTTDGFQATMIVDI